MVLDFYFHPMSPPSRMAYMTLKALDVKHEIKIVDLMKGEQKSPEFLKVSPRGKIPAVRDGDFCVAESRAIATYLCNNYEKDTKESLYPKDPKARAKVDQLLYVSENLNEVIVGYLRIGGVIFGDATGPDEAKLPEVHKQLALYEEFLSQNKFTAADHLTLADFFMASPLLLLPVSGFDDYCNYPKTVAWLKKVKELPYFDECNKEGVEKLFGFYKGKVAEKQGKK